MDRIKGADVIVLTDHHHDPPANGHKLGMRHCQLSPARQTESKGFETIFQPLFDLFNVHSFA